DDHICGWRGSAKSRVTLKATLQIFCVSGFLFRISIKNIKISCLASANLSKAKPRNALLKTLYIKDASIYCGAPGSKGWAVSHSAISGCVADGPDAKALGPQTNCGGGS